MQTLKGLKLTHIFSGVKIKITYLIELRVNVRHEP